MNTVELKAKSGVKTARTVHSTSLTLSDPHPEDWVFTGFSIPEMRVILPTEGNTGGWVPFFNSNAGCFLAQVISSFKETCG